MESIESKSLLDHLKSFMSFIDKAFKNIDMKVSNIETTKNGNLVFTVINNDNKSVKAQCVKVPEEDGLYDIYVKSEDGQKKKRFTNVTRDQIVDKCVEAGDAFYDFFGGAETVTDENGKELDVTTLSSKHLDLILEKIISSQDSSINLVSVTADYDPAEAFLDLTTVLDDDDFVEALPEGSSGYEVTQDDSCYNVCEMTEDNEIYQSLTKETNREELCGYLITLCTKLYVVQFDSDYIYRLCTTQPKTRESASCLKWLSSDMISRYQDLYEEYCGGVMHAAQCTSCIYPYLGGDDISDKQRLRCVVTEVIDTLNFYYCNFTHDVQKMMDEDIRSFSHIVKIDLR